MISPTPGWTPGSAVVLFPAGDGCFFWEGTDDRGASMPSGVYVYRLQAGSNRASGRLLLLR
ncbi:hypothetical protein JW906_01820 [bacterium]|nr:hypothetical protein [bacterium]